jgi:hypothetical protein
VDSKTLVASAIMPTIIGLVLIAAASWFAYRGEGRLFGFLIFASIFQASSALNIGSNGLQPFYLIAIMYVVSRWKHLSAAAKLPFPGKYALLLFVALAVVSAFLYPVLFSGIPVYSPLLNIDEGFLYRLPLAFRFSNIVQAAFLMVNALVIVAASTEHRRENIERFYDATFYFLAALLFVQFAFQFLHIPFPYSLIQNNPGYSMATTSAGDLTSRLAGTFTESSGAGLALIIFFAGYLYRYYMRSEAGLKLLLSAVAISLVRSSSSLIAAAAITGAIVVLNPPFRFPWFVNRPRLGKTILLAMIPVLVWLSPLNSVFAAQTTEKADTVSYVHRLAADMYAFGLVAQTHGIGVGLGSNRPSSFAASLLSCVGIPGTLLLAIFLFQSTRRLPQDALWVKWALFAGVIDACLGVPDINQPMVWIVIALAVLYSAHPIGVPGVEDTSAATAAAS